jgi:glycosyltransferase involved in cell wall biosynthesis
LEACRKPDTFSGIIIVENGHKNGTEEVVRSYNPRLKVRYIYIPQASQSLAKNKALEVVADGLIIFTDDARMPGRLREMSEGNFTAVP